MYSKGGYAQFLYGNTTRLNQKESQFDIELIGFNTYTFSDIIISNIPDTYDKNTIDIQTYEHSSHGLGLSNWLIRDKTITINGRILAENENELEKKIKRIKANLLTGNGTLYLKKSDGILQTKASVTKLEIPRESRTINSTPITIIFKILDPFFYSTKMNEIGYFNINKNLTTTLLYNEGTHNSKPSVFISFKEAQYVTSILLSINGKKLLINQRIKAGDSISINAEKLDVAKNGKYGIDWIGEFGELQTGENEINIEIDGEFNTEIFLKRRNTYI